MSHQKTYFLFVSLGFVCIISSGVCMKTRTNVSIDSRLLEAARANKIVLSHLLEEALKERLKDTEQQAWEEENRQAINAYNEFIKENGTFSDELRSF